eukprot:7622017-Prorocentrum_lima.AAC.1
MSGKRRNPELQQTRQEWMQHYLKLQDIQKENRYLACKPNQDGQIPNRGPVKARVAQPIASQL